MKVQVISNHNLLGHSLVAMLEQLDVPQDESVEASLCDAVSAVACLGESQAEVVLVEAITSFREGIATLRTIKNACPAIPVLLLSVADDEAAAYESVKVGAEGYLSQDASSSAFIATLLGLKRGELGLSRTAASHVVRQLRQAVETGGPHPPSEISAKLTPREREVLNLICDGMRSRDIAQELGLAEATIYKHVQNILQKLHVKSRAQAILVAKR